MGRKKRSECEATEGKIIYNSRVRKETQQRKYKRKVILHRNIEEEDNNSSELW